ncbi:urease accessory protein UreD, partial [Streptomyces beijiangensis]
LAGEAVMAGRLARGERNAYQIFASDFEVRRPDGELTVLDTVRLEPSASGVSGPAMLGGRGERGDGVEGRHDVVAAEVADT